MGMTRVVELLDFVASEPVLRVQGLFLFLADALLAVDAELAVILVQGEEVLALEAL